MANIGIDLSWMRIGKVGGAEQATYELIRGLSELDPENRYRLESPRSTYFDWQFPSGFRHKVTFTDRVEKERRVRRSEFLSRKRKVDRAFDPVDLLHAPSGYVREDARFNKLIVTIHDLQHLDFPQYFTREERAYRDKQLAGILAIAAGLICISDFTKARLIEHYRVSADTISTIWMAPDPAIARPVPDRLKSDFLGTLGITRPFLLYPSYPWAHKNHTRLLRAWNRFRRGEKSDPWQLVLTGAPFPEAHPAFAELMTSIERGETLHLGYRTPLEMRMLFQSAEVLIFPSEYEGFGLPVAEAFSAGLPVAASRAGSLPEIAGEAALYFDPTSEDAIEEALRRMVHDPDLRDNLRRKGRERALLFSADELARKTLAAYRKILSSETEAKEVSHSSRDTDIRGTLRYPLRFEKFRHYARKAENAARRKRWLAMAWFAFAAAACAPGRAVGRLGGGAACHVEVFLLRLFSKGHGN